MASVIFAKLSKAIAVGKAALTDRLHPIPEPSPVLLDVGARGGLQNKWRVYSKIAPLRAVFSEPDANEIPKLQKTGTVLPVALGRVSGMQPLYITKDPACSSLLKPSRDALRSARRNQMRVVAEISVEVRRADVALKMFGIPNLDFIKIDTQGAELDVLEGLGDQIDSVCGIEVECAFLPLYEGQPVLDEIIRFLKGRGFVLAAIKPNGLIDGAIWEVNAYFLRANDDAGIRERRLIQTWRRVNRLPTSRDYSIDAG